MRRPSLLFALLIPILPGSLYAQPTRAPGIAGFITVDAPLFALAHVRIIDGRGGAALEDQTIIVSGGTIQAIGAAASTAIPDGAEVISKPGYTVIPGIVGMHDHIFYPAGPGHYNTLEYSAPRLYLAAGVTTIRTTGGMEPYAELNLKRAIQEGRVPGPSMHVTSPYLEGPGAFTLQMHELKSSEEAREMVAYWDGVGIDDFKAYTNITRAQLAAAIEEVHQRGKKITGHLCSIGFREAAELGIDNLEHGLLVDTEFYPGKEPDVCPPSAANRQALLALDIGGEEVQETIRQLVAHGVAVTSTLPVFEISVPGRPPVDTRVLEAMGPSARESYLTRRAQIGSIGGSPSGALLEMEMAFELAFFRAGGLLLAGPDPTGYGGVLPGFGNHREIELLVEAGLTPVEAIKVATYNGADYLGQLRRIGTLEPGKQADMVLIQGDPSTDISEIRQVETVFKAGVGYDSGRLFQAVKGTVGVR
ncbi:MAG: amidohydrolase family protein [Longimicrobiales bacterium]